MMFRTCRAVIKPISPAISAAQNIRVAQSTKVAASEVCVIDPEYMYVHVSGLHGTQKDNDPKSPGQGQYRGNQNGDFFWWKKTLLAQKEKLGMRAFETWRGKDNLENHDETRVLGDIPDVWLDVPNKSVDMLIRTSTKRAWPICASVRKGSVTDVSMGVLVGHSFCSLCDNRAETEADWCNDLQHKKGQFIHVDELPSQKRDANRNGMWCYEDNRDVYGIEVSWITVGEGADSDAIVKNLIFDAEAAKQQGKVGRMNTSIMDSFWNKHGKRY